MTRPPTPARVKNMEEFWQYPPPEPSARLSYWIDKLSSVSWQPNRRLSCHGYWYASEFYGVWVWEYTRVLSPVANTWNLDTSLPVPPNPSWIVLLAKAASVQSLRRSVLSRNGDAFRSHR